MISKLRCNVSEWINNKTINTQEPMSGLTFSYIILYYIILYFFFILYYIIHIYTYITFMSLAADGPLSYMELSATHKKLR